MTGYWDIVIVLGIATVMLLVLDWRINKAFHGHEERERRMYADLQLLSDGAAGAAREAARHVREVQATQTLQKVAVENLTDEVRIHGTRLDAVEKTILRAALTIPHVHRREGDPP